MKPTTIVVATGLMLAAGSAAATVTIPGTADPFLAGAPSGAFVDWGGGDDDIAPADSPVGFAVTAGETVTISDITGSVCNNPGPPCATGPISSSSFTPNGFTERVSGFTNLTINSLIGVFVDPTSTTNTVFEIGSGGSFVVPAGATEFYLATVDGFQWNNNSGAFQADVSVPEPAEWALLLAGFAGLGAALRSRRRAIAA